MQSLHLPTKPLTNHHFPLSISLLHQLTQGFNFDVQSARYVTRHGVSSGQRRSNLPRGWHVQRRLFHHHRTSNSRPSLHRLLRYSRHTRFSFTQFFHWNCRFWFTWLIDTMRSSPEFLQIRQRDCLLKRRRTMDLSSLCSRKRSSVDILVVIASNWLLVLEQLKEEMIFASIMLLPLMFLVKSSIYDFVFTFFFSIFDSLGYRLVISLKYFNHLKLKLLQNSS